MARHNQPRKFKGIAEREREREHMGYRFQLHFQVYTFQSEIKTRGGGGVLLAQLIEHPTLDCRV